MWGEGEMFDKGTEAPAAGIGRSETEAGNSGAPMPVIAFPAWGGGGGGAAGAGGGPTALDVEVLRKCFGAFLLVVGAMELFGKKRPEGK